MRIGFACRLNARPRTWITMVALATSIFTHNKYIHFKEKAMRVVVSPERNPDRIEGFCEIPGWRGEQSVISLLRRGDEWTVGSSMALLSDLNQSKEVMACYNKVFETLEEIKGKG